MAPAATPSKRSSTKKAATKPRTKSTKAKTSSSSSTSAASKSVNGGRYVALIVEAIRELKIRGGASRQKIAAYIEENHKDTDPKQVKLAFKRGVSAGVLSQHGHSFRAGTKSASAAKPKMTKPKAATTATKTKTPAVKKAAPKTKKTAAKKSTSKSPKKAMTKSPKKKAATKKATSKA